MLLAGGADPFVVVVVVASKGSSAVSVKRCFLSLCLFSSEFVFLLVETRV